MHFSSAASRLYTELMFVYPYGRKRRRVRRPFEAGSSGGQVSRRHFLFGRVYSGLPHFAAAQFASVRLWPQTAQCKHAFRASTTRLEESSHHLLLRDGNPHGILRGQNLPSSCSEHTLSTFSAESAAEADSRYSHVSVPRGQDNVNQAAGSFTRRHWELPIHTAATVQAHTVGEILRGTFAPRKSGLKEK